MINTQDLALAVAGVIGSAVALVHGVLTQRLIVRPLEVVAAPKLPRSIRQLAAMLLHFSTFNWFIGGLALIVAALTAGHEVKLAVGLLVGSSYLYGAIGNLIATRGRHPGWMLYAIALALIAYALYR
jgi:hypothetical protein